MNDSARHGGWDDIIVGAGSAGAVLASRLSEQSGRRVLLLEAGPGSAGLAPQSGPGGKPIVGQPILEGANWEFSAYVQDDGGREYAYHVGRVVGGSSAVNNALAIRGLPSDFDGWASAGNPDWAWEHVLPFYNRLESDADFGGPGHGSDGPVPIVRMSPAEYNKVADAFVHGCRELGLPEVADLNGDPGIGVGPQPTNTLDGRRMSVADTYLVQARGRPNLTVWDNCHVTSLQLAGQRVTGVEMLRDGQRHRVSAGHVTLSAGAVNTPLILQRSGIGAADRLTALGIAPVADLRGVGENLIDHPVISIWALPKAGICQDGGPWHSAMARLSVAGGNPDVSLSMLNNVASSGERLMSPLLGGRMAVTVTAMLLSPQARGRVFLRDASPDAKPKIVLGLASEPRDIDRLMEGTRRVWSVIRCTPFAELLDRVVIWTDRMVADDTMLTRSIAKFVAPQWHPVGTAKMGPASDNLAVVDQHGKVHCIDGLRVVDASIMPTIPSAPTNLSCIMLGERVAEWMA